MYEIRVNNQWVGDDSDFFIFHLGIHSCGTCHGFDLAILGFEIGFRAG